MIPIDPAVIDPTVSQMQARVIFAVTVRNNPDLLARCLESVAAQTYKAVRCLVIDDASEDATGQVAQRWAKDRSDIFDVTVNGSPQGKMANLVNIVTRSEDHDIVVELDGDDRLITDEAAGDLARLHMRSDLIWTQHQLDRGPFHDWEHWPSTDIPYPHRNGQVPRLPWTRAWHPGHLRSFKAWAFRSIDQEEMQLNGRWVQSAADVAYFSPLVEMTPPSKRYFYDRQLAMYQVTPENEHFKTADPLLPPQTQFEVATELFSRPGCSIKPAPTAVGLIDPSNTGTTRAACADLLRRCAGTTVILGSSVPGLGSWHPRVQLISLPPRLVAPTAAAGDADKLSWLLDIANQGADAGSVSLIHRDQVGGSPR